MKGDDQTLQIEITIATVKCRKGGQRRSTGGPKVPDPPSIPRTTRLMALAIKFQDMVDRGEVRDYADLARLGSVSRARITQVMNLLNLAPDIQEEILLGRLTPGTRAETQLRPIASVVVWQEQQRLWGLMEHNVLPVR